MRNISLVSVALILCAFSALWAQSGSSSFDFLLIGAGARAAAVGEAFTAVSGDANAPFFNPASAGVIDGTEFSFSHVSYFTDVTLENFSLVSGSNKFHYGLGLYYGKIGNIERRGNIPSENPLGTFDEHNFVASFIWAAPVSKKLFIGNSVKWAYEKLDTEAASALALDFGAYYILNPQLSLGASARNLGTKPKFIDTSFDLPRELRLGASYTIMGQSPLFGLILSGDYILPRWGDNDNKLNLGAEYNYQNLISLRSGYGFGYESKNFSIGLGIAYQNYNFDYAFVPARHNLGDTHRFTFRLKL